MTGRIRISKIKDVLLYGLLFLAAMNFQAKFFYFVFISFFVILATQNRLRIDKTSLLYLCVCCIMSLYNHKEGILSMIRCFAPFCFYLVGLNLISDASLPGANHSVLDEVQKRGYVLLVAISLGSFAHYGLNYLLNLGASLGRNTNDIWTGQPMAATGQNALACLMMGFSVATLFLPRKKWHRIAASLTIVLMLVYNLVLASRTMIVILSILLLIGLFYPKKRAISAKQTIKAVSVLCLLGIAVAVIYLHNVGNIQGYVKHSLLFNRLGGSFDMLLDNGSRTSVKLKFLANMMQYPFGGLHMRAKYSYAHDLLLDAYDEYGVVVFLLLIAALILGCLQMYRLLRQSAYSDGLKLPLLLIYAAILLEFTVEPILAGMPWLFSCYCLINGCVTGMNRFYYRYGKRSRQIPQ